MNKEYGIFGFAYECPFQKRSADCPFVEIDQLSFKEKIIWIEDMSSDKKESIVKHHSVCTWDRELKMNKQF
jgi:hypothetical protein